jgi:DNA-binding CsgD family transcriptional regulator
MTDQVPGTTPTPTLSLREREVLALLYQRRTNAEMATQLGLRVRTVEHHVSRILAKLKVANRRDAVHRAQELGIDLHASFRERCLTKGPTC